MYLGLYEKALPASLGLGEKLAAAAECGFDFMEMSIDEGAEKLSRLSWTRAQRREAAGYCSAAGIHFKTMCLSAHRKYPLGSEDNEVRARSVEIPFGNIRPPLPRGRS